MNNISAWNWSEQEIIGVKFKGTWGLIIVFRRVCGLKDNFWGQYFSAAALRGLWHSSHNQIQIPITNLIMRRAGLSSLKGHKSPESESVIDWLTDRGWCKRCYRINKHDTYMMSVSGVWHLCICLSLCLCHYQCHCGQWWSTFIFDILESPPFQKYRKWWVF